MDEVRENPSQVIKNPDNTLGGKLLLKKIGENLNISLSHQGQLNIDSGKLKSLSKSLPADGNNKDFNQLLSVTDNDFDNLSIASMVSLFPDPNSPGDWLYSTTGQKRKKELKKLFSAFRKTTEDIFSEDKTGEKLKQSLNRDLEKDQSLNFSQLNHELTMLMYQKTYPLYPLPSNSDLEIFLKHPGITDSIGTLRKIFFVKLLDNQLNSLKLNPDNPLHLSPSSDIWSKMQSFIDFYYNFGGKEIPLMKFSKLSDNEIVEQLAFLAAENRLRVEPQDFNQGIINGKITDEGKNYSYHLPISERPEEQLNYKGVVFPTTVMANFDSLKYI